MSKVFGALMEPFHRVVGGWYRRQVEKELIKYGLRYDDLLDPNMNLDVKEALNRLPQSEIDLRNQRIKRAIDISQKHTELPDEFKKLQTPFKHYLKPMVKQVELENEERASLGTGKPYDRQIP
uniref:Cytochrome b-c1 complex subunit 7 n=3 Tax=Eukaryota TaxID=2759 RepID=A0A7S1MZT3_9EUKA|mmetsp:Transcript_3747/g.8547  ORF Transcript_3747/g.8547 Transcript_3747/m.8547 type:complete len:123 (+) Transcript_3747:83-451(+)